MHGQGLFSKSSKKPHIPNHPSNHSQGKPTVGCMGMGKMFLGEEMRPRSPRVNPGGANEVPYLQFPEMWRHDQLVHAVFTRQGGVSKAPYDTLNASYMTGDKPECVSSNLQIIKEAIGANELVFMNQMHGKEILALRGERFEALGDPVDADAMITDQPQVALMVKQADCQAVLLFDPIKDVVANVHCGWRGNVHNILGSVVGRMNSEFGCRSADLLAAIGPSLGPCCAEFVNYEQEFPEGFGGLWSVRGILICGRSAAGNCWVLELQRITLRWQISARAAERTCSIPTGPKASRGGLPRWLC